MYECMCMSVYVYMCVCVCVYYVICVCVCVENTTRVPVGDDLSHNEWFLKRI